MVSQSTDTLSAGEARSIALAAQGFGGASEPGDGSRPTVNALARVAKLVHIFQIDPINVLVRSQYLPAYARLGDYDMDRLDALCYERRGVFEYVGHEWSMVDVELHPLLRWRMAAFAADRRWVRDLPAGYADDVLREVTQRGPLTPSELAAPGKRGGRFEAKPGKQAMRRTSCRTSFWHGGRWRFRAGRVPEVCDGTQARRPTRGRRRAAPGPRRRMER